MFTTLEARASYVSSCTSSLGARVPHVSYVNLLMAEVSHAWCINILGLDYDRALYYVPFIIHLRASESSVSRINKHYIKGTGPG